VTGVVSPERGSRAGSRRVVVVGGGAAGVAAALELGRAGVEVAMLESAARLGGCVRTVDFGQARVDVGAEAVHTATPEPLQFLADLGLSDELVAAHGSLTWIAGRHRLRPLPAGVGPTGPTRLTPLVTSRLLGPIGLARAAMEPLVPRTPTGQDPAVGAVLEQRFGRQVVARIVDPLLGGLHAGDVQRLSLAATTPQLAAVLAGHRSLLLASRRRTAPAGHGFVTLRQGLGHLFEVAAARIAGEVRQGTTVRAVVDTGWPASRYRVVTDTGDLSADAVVLAVPARIAAHLMRGLDAEASRMLAGARSATVAVALLAYPGAIAGLDVLRGTGVLVPSTSGRLLKAATFVTTKWPHLDSPHVLVRASAGRADDRRVEQLDDGDLVASLTTDLAEIAGLPATPVDHAVVRWNDAMPQLEVGHRLRISAVRTQLTEHPGLVLAGASYDGVGIASAVRSGTAAARQVLAQLTGGAT
jgi:protoporphyrinogen/coproporphyrinogen III oxidase